MAYQVSWVDNCKQDLQSITVHTYRAVRNLVDSLDTQPTRFSHITVRAVNTRRRFNEIVIVVGQ